MSSGPLSLVGPVNFTSVTVGDYIVSGSGAAVESCRAVKRAADDHQRQPNGGYQSATPLDVYVIATNYVLPNPPGSLDTTHGATYTDVGGGASTAASVGFQGWYVAPG